MGKYNTKSVGVLKKIDANNAKIASPPVFGLFLPFSQKS